MFFFVVVVKILERIILVTWRKFLGGVQNFGGG